MESSVVYCGICKKNTTPKEEIDASSWVCAACLRIEFSIGLMPWLQEKVRDTITVPEDEYRFAFRELVQNADDVEATTLVARWDSDALTVVNDGKAFRIGDDKENDFKRLGRVLEGHKSRDASKAGNFGSGFQTVFCFSNAPEIYSNSTSLRLDPAHIHSEANATPIIDSELKSPYGARGVRFRFPWRDDKAARTKSQDGRQMFLQGWSRWDTKRRRELFDDLCDYAHDLLLTCQHLKRIRLLWAEAGEDGVQFERDFDCVSPDARRQATIGTVSRSSGWGSYTADDWRAADGVEFAYFIAHARVQDTSGRIVVPADEITPDGTSRTIVADKEIDGKRYHRLKLPDVWIAIPLFPAIDRHKTARTRWVHSTIPLTLRTQNHFVLNAHLFPEESRKDIDITGKAGEWCRLVRDSAIQLYADIYESFVTQVKSMPADPDRQQQIFLDHLPAPREEAWLKELAGDDSRPSRIENYVIPRVLDQKILLTSTGWVAPKDAAIARTPVEADVLDKLEIPRFTKPFLEHPRYEYIKEFLAENGFNEEAFESHWQALVDQHKGTRPGVYLGDVLGKVRIDNAFVRGLMTYAVGTTNPLRGAAVVPCRDGCLRALKHLARLEDEWADLAPLLPDEVTVHADYESLVPDNHVRVFEDHWMIFIGLAKRSPDEQKACIGRVFKYISARRVEPNILAGLQRNPDLRVFPTGDGRTASYNDIRMPDDEYSELMRALFVRAGITAEWIHPEIQREHSEMLRRLKLQHPNYSTLGKAVNWSETTVKERVAYIHGMVRNHQLPQSRVAAIPVGGIAIPADEAMIGTTENVVLDTWFNVLEEDFRNALSDAGLLRALHLKDASKPEDLVDRLQRRREADSARFDDLNEDDWIAITELIALLSEARWVPKGPMRFHTAVLPIRTDGRIQLSPFAPPGIDRSEKAHRSFPYLPGSDGKQEPHPKLMARLKIVALHANGSIDAAELYRRTKEAWGLWPLQEVNIVRHFIADYKSGPQGELEEPSLFRDAALKMFVPDATETERVTIKKSLLTIAQTYFSHKRTESGLKPSQMAKVPLLYDRSGTWRPPEDLLLPHVAIRESPGAYLLHDDFQKWDRSTLEALGVRERLDTDQLVGAINEARANDDIPALCRAVVHLLTVNGDVTDAAKRLATTSWVPTLGGHIRLAGDTLLPAPSVTKLLGNRHPALVQLEDAPGGEIVSQALQRGDEDLAERAAQLGIRLQTRLADMLGAVTEFKAAGEPPPEPLFDAIERDPGLKKRVLEVDERLLLGYFAAGRWWNADEMFLDKVPNLPDILREDIVVLKKSRHADYLRVLGVRGSPSVDTLLMWLRSIEPAEAGSIWAELVRRNSEITDDVRDRNSVELIAIPPLDAKVTPLRCLIDPDLASLLVDGHQIVALASNDPNAVTLALLGAKGVANLDTPTLQRIYERLPWDAPDKVYRTLLSQMSERDDVDPLSLTLVVSHPDGVRRKIGETYWPEPREVANLFIEDLPFVSTTRVPFRSRRFRTWAEKFGLRTLDHPTLQELPPANISAAEDDQLERERLARMADALGQRAELDPSAAEAAFGWLRTCQVKRLPQIYVQLRVAETTRRHARAYFLERQNEHTTLYVPNRGPSGFYSELAEAILRECEQRGLQVGADLRERLTTDAEHMLHWTEWWRLGLSTVNEIEFDRGMILTLEATPTQDGQIRKRLADWYEGCQICGVQTPVSQDFSETEETLKAIVSGKGGLYPGTRHVELGNFLWLCPTHQKYYERKLVRILILDDKNADALSLGQGTIERALAAAELRENELLQIDNICDVPNARVERTTLDGPGEGIHRVTSTRTVEKHTHMTFSVRHYLEMLKVCERYLLETEGI